MTTTKPATRNTMTERRIGTILATAGTPLTLAGALMYVLPGPGFPVLVIGLATLITGLVMTATTPRT
ncbi:hypothetical protein ACFZC3_29005 [Streptomyces sp. NPDC007903]|uniref:hypothetical protein n=1 Tax=Streptomyces sp. NPDC007903 TaxID=3364786 RepID=UPI0036E5AEC3